MTADREPDALRFPQSLHRQASDPESTLCRFLDTHLPGRGRIAEQWRTRLGGARLHPIDIRTDYALLGQAFEIRLGLDLADRPPYTGLLRFLPADRYAELINAAGFRIDGLEHLPPTGTTDPILRAWKRQSRPDDLTGSEQIAALHLCLDVCSIDAFAHAVDEGAVPVEACRALFLKFRGDRQANTEPDPAVTALTHLWAGYLKYGRDAICELGDRVHVSPELAVGFATADLVVGRTLVDVKVSTVPGELMHAWLNQLLGYFLLDRANVMELEQVALYLGRQGLLLTASVDDVLQTAPGGTAPELWQVRQAFREAMRDDCDGAEEKHARDRYRRH